MPPRAADKKGGLTLEKLASYDDVITDALVDKIYYWTTIRKNRGGRFSASRGLQEEDLAEIIRKTVAVEKDPNHAVQQLLRLPGLRKFLAALKDEKERDHFTRHLSRYVKIYMPDCPFEVTTTNRYAIHEHEASVTARKDIKPREEIKYLTGVRVAMTEEEEKKIELARKDFSMVISSRKKTRSLFLGPARFANHDCDANARLSTTGHDGMQIVAVKPILTGDEITVSYGEDYFGDDNEECLCQTCEDRLVNGWAPLKPIEDNDEDSGEDEQKSVDTSQQDAARSPCGKRKFDSSAEATPQTAPAPKKLKLEEVDDSPLSAKPSLPSPTKRRIPRPLREATLKKAHSSSSLRQEVPISSIETSTTYLPAPRRLSRDIRTQQRDGLLTVSLDDTVSSRETTPQSSTAAGSPKSDQSTDATSVDEDNVMIDSQKNEKTDLNPSLGVATIKVEVSTVRTSLPSILSSVPNLEDDDRTSDLSELSSSYELDDVLQQVVKRKRSKTPPLIRNTRARSRNEEKTRPGTPLPVDDLENYVENTRKPGDYVRSNALLSAKYSKWVECHTCEDVFVQQDGYHTRKECPRCERHSKLYGFAWPKTDKEGKHDKEERITDHRTVHRFVDPDEEKIVKKGKKLLRQSIATRFSTPRSFRDSSMSTEADSGRSRRRVRKTM